MLKHNLRPARRNLVCIGGELRRRACSEVRFLFSSVPLVDGHHGPQRHWAPAARLARQSRRGRTEEKRKRTFCRSQSPQSRPSGQPRRPTWRRMHGAVGNLGVGFRPCRPNARLAGCRSWPSSVSLGSCLSSSKPDRPAQGGSAGRSDRARPRLTYRKTGLGAESKPGAAGGSSELANHMETQTQPVYTRV